VTKFCLKTFWDVSGKAHMDPVFITTKEIVLVIRFRENQSLAVCIYLVGIF